MSGGRMSVADLLHATLLMYPSVCASCIGVGVAMLFFGLTWGNSLVWLIHDLDARLHLSPMLPIFNRCLISGFTSKLVSQIGQRFVIYVCLKLQIERVFSSVVSFCSLFWGILLVCRSCLLFSMLCDFFFRLLLLFLRSVVIQLRVLEYLPDRFDRDLKHCRFLVFGNSWLIFLVCLVLGVLLIWKSCVLSCLAVSVAGC